MFSFFHLSLHFTKELGQKKITSAILAEELVVQRFGFMIAVLLRD